MAATSAKGWHRLTDSDLKKLTHMDSTWYGKKSRVYLRRDLVQLQQLKFGSKANFDAKNASLKPYHPGSVGGFVWRHYGFYGGYY